MGADRLSSRGTGRGHNSSKLNALSAQSRPPSRCWRSTTAHWSTTFGRDTTTDLTEWSFESGQRVRFDFVRKLLLARRLSRVPSSTRVPRDESAGSDRPPLALETIEDSGGSALGHERKLASPTPTTTANHTKSSRPSCSVRNHSPAAGAVPSWPSFSILESQTPFSVHRPPTTNPPQHTMVPESLQILEPLAAAVIFSILWFVRSKDGNISVDDWDWQKFAATFAVGLVVTLGMASSGVPLESEHFFERMTQYTGTVVLVQGMIQAAVRNLRNVATDNSDAGRL